MTCFYDYFFELIESILNLSISDAPIVIGEALVNPAQINTVTSLFHGTVTS